MSTAEPAAADSRGSSMPLISFVVAARNAEAFLVEALASIPPPASLGAECEIVVADGGSSDTTVSLATADQRVRIVSRQDHGIYDGMNRAIAEARGDLTLILNSDDLLLPDGFAAAARLMLSDPSLGHASGGALFGAAPGAAIHRRHDGPLTVEGALFGIPAINARLFRTKLMRAIGPIRSDIGLAGDREWVLRLARRGARSARLPEPFYFYRTHPGSQTLAGGLAGRRRVYQAEARLAAWCLAEGGLTPEERRLARAELAVAQAKLQLTGGGAAAAVPRSNERLGLADGLRGIALALRWRGRLSGW